MQFTSPDTSITTNVVFDVNDEGRVRLPPGEYRWSAPEVSGATGVSAVEAYSDEFHPRPVTLQTATASAGFDVAFAYAREYWWLFALALAAFIGEWAWRQRRGLP